MPTVLRYKPDVAKLAVYETADVLNPSDGPINDPLNNLSSIKFHSDLRYPRFVPSKIADASYTLTLAPNNRIIQTDINVATHGMADVPVVFGKINSVTASVQSAANLAPADTPWCGSVPIWKVGFSRALFAALGANSTHVVLRLYGIVPPAGGNLGTITINFRYYVLDTTVTTDAFDADGSLPQLKLEGTRIRVARGKFDTNFSYMRQGSTTDPVVLAKGESMVLKGTPNASPLSDGNQQWGFRYSVNGKVIDSDQATSTFNATIATAGL